MDPIGFARFLSAAAMGMSGLGLAFVLVRGRLGAISRRRLPLAPPRPLTQPELDELLRWQRRTMRFFAAAMGLILAFGVLCALARWLPAAALLGAQAFVLCAGVAALAVHFSARCPLCGWRIGYQSALLLPPACEICGAVFRPNAPLAGLTRAPVHVVSRIRIHGLPLFAVSIGGDPARGTTRGVARGIIAVGDVAIGAVAVGGVAAGGIAVGGVSLGAISIGGVSIGIAALGGVAAGWLALGGLALGAYAVGGLALGAALRLH